MAVTNPPLHLSLKRSHEKVQEKRSLDSWRELRHQQDEQFAQSLLIDQEKVSLVDYLKTFSLNNGGTQLFTVEPLIVDSI